MENHFEPILSKKSEPRIIQMDITGLNDLDLVYHHLANNKIVILTYKMSDEKEKARLEKQCFLKKLSNPIEEEIIA